MKKIIFTICAVSFLLGNSCSKEKTEEPVDTGRLLSEAVDYGEKGYWEKAAAMASEVIKHEPGNTDALLTLGIAYSYMGKTGDAVDELKKVCDKDPGSFIAQYMTGYLLFKKKEYNEALPFLAKAREIDANNVSPIILLGETYMILGDSQKASTYFALAAKSPELKNNSGPWNELGVLFLERKETSKASRCFVHAYKLDPDSPVVTLNLATLLDKYLNKKANAVKFYKSYLNLTEGNPELDKKREAVQKRIKEISAASSDTAG